MGNSMISTFILATMISIEEPKAIIQSPIKTEARKRGGKGNRGRRRGGGGLRQMRVQVMNCVMELITRNNIYRGIQTW